MKNLFLLFFLFIFVTNPAYPQDTIYVPGDYSTIQAGIDAANVGNIVLVAEDTYYENINFKGKAITVASLFLIDGDSTHILNTIIDGSQPIYPDSASVVSFFSGEDTTSVLCGFTITGGTGTIGETITRAGGGIAIYLSGATICNNIIEFNSLDSINAFGGGIYVGYNNIVIIKNNIIRNNSVTGDTPLGGGISLQYSGLTYIRSNHIIDNDAIGRAASGGGIDLNVSLDELIIENNYIEGNTTTQTNIWGGGGIDLYSWGAPVTVSNNLIVNNTGYNGGGILVAFESAVSTKSAALNLGNISGIKKESSSAEYLQDIPVLLNNTIVDNSADFGGGIYCDSNSDLIIINNNISGNQANTEGGGLYAYNSVIQIDSCIINSNNAVGSEYPKGGGIYVSDSELQMDNCNITANETMGDSLYGCSGGGIYALNSQLLIVSCDFYNNKTTGGSGGGIRAVDSELLVEGCLFDGNEATPQQGGGIKLSRSDLQIDNCVFKNNKSTDSNGGAINVVTNTMYSGVPFLVEIKNSQFLNNTASSRGAGVDVNNWMEDTLAINVEIDNCEFIDNSADNSTGLNILRCSFSVTKTIFRGNTAVRYSAGAAFNRSSGTVTNCLFASNDASTGGGNYNSGGAGPWGWSIVDFMNCTFANNTAGYGAGLTVGRGSVSTITNCIFWGNSNDQIALDTYDNEGGTLYVNYCDVQGGEDSVNVIDPLLSTLNWGIKNIDADPFFEDPLISDYHLQNSSPCIGTAIDTIEINGIMCYCPHYDIEGNPRPDPDSSKPDIGAYESELANPVGVEEDATVIPTDYALYQNYPNPFNPSTTIKYQIPEISFVTLIVYDVLGGEVAALVNEEKPVGSYEVEYNVTQLPSGIYFYRLQAGDYIETKKMILMK